MAAIFWNRFGSGNSYQNPQETVQCDRNFSSNLTTTITYKPD
ncbi:hypothetical protein [Nostoc sp.]